MSRSDFAYHTPRSGVKAFGKRSPELMIFDWKRFHALTAVAAHGMIVLSPKGGNAPRD